MSQQWVLAVILAASSAAHTQAANTTRFKLTRANVATVTDGSTDVLCGFRKNSWIPVKKNGTLYSANIAATKGHKAACKQLPEEGPVTTLAKLQNVP